MQGMVRLRASKLIDMRELVVHLNRYNRLRILRWWENSLAPIDRLDTHELKEMCRVAPGDMILGMEIRNPPLRQVV